MKLHTVISAIGRKPMWKKQLARVAPVVIGCAVSLLLLLWAWYQIKAILFGAAGIAILVGAYALKKRLF